MNPAEQYVLEAPSPFREIMIHLMVLIETAAPDAVLLYKWKLPFYYLNSKMFCFLNYRRTFVDVGIPNGILLATRPQLIAGKNRKSLRSLRFHTLEDIDDNTVLSILAELLALQPPHKK